MVVHHHQQHQQQQHLDQEDLCCQFHGKRLDPLIVSSIVCFSVQIVFGLLSYILDVRSTNNEYYYYQDIDDDAWAPIDKASISTGSVAVIALALSVPLMYCAGRRKMVTLADRCARTTGGGGGASTAAAGAMPDQLEQVRKVRKVMKICAITSWVLYGISILNGIVLISTGAADVGLGPGYILWTVIWSIVPWVLMGAYTYKAELLAEQQQEQEEGVDHNDTAPAPKTMHPHGNACAHDESHTRSSNSTSSHDDDDDDDDDDADDDDDIEAARDDAPVSVDSKVSSKVSEDGMTTTKTETKIFKYGDGTRHKVKTIVKDTTKRTGTSAVVKRKTTVIETSRTGDTTKTTTSTKVKE